MHRNKTVVAFFLVFYILLLGHCAITAEKSDDLNNRVRVENVYEDDYVDHHNTFRENVVTLAGQDSNDDAAGAAQRSMHDIRSVAVINGESSIIGEQLRKYYNPTVLKIRAKLSTRIVVKAGLTVLAAFPIFQIFVPASLGGLGELGVTDQMFSTGAAIGTVAPPVLILGSMAVFNHASRIFTKVPEDILRTQKIVTDRNYAWYERWAYSPINTVLQIVAWEMLWAGIITYLESDLSAKWGPFWVYSLIFSALFLAPIYGMNVASTNDEDDNPFRSYETDEDRENHEMFSSVVNCAIEEVQKGNKNVRKVLAGHLNVLPRQTPVGTRTPLLLGQDAPAAPLSSTSVSTLENASLLLESGSERLAQRVQKDTYLQLWDYLIDVYNDQPNYQKAWRNAREQIAKWGAAGIQAASLPMREMVSYAIPYLFFEYFTSQQAATAFGIVGTIIFTQSNFANAFKELPLVRNGLRNIMRLYPPNSPPCWGNYYLSFIPDRLQALTSVSLSTLYIVIPQWVFLRHVVLEHVFGIHNLSAQLILILPYLAGTPFSSAQIFASEQLSHIHNGASKVIPCCPSEHVSDLVEGQMVIEKLKEVDTKTKKLNEIHSKHLKKSSKALNNGPRMPM